MRQIGVLPDAFQARALADYLLTLRIETRLEPQPEGVALWVCDEDRVPQARTELEAFRQDPRAARYTAAAPVAEALRRQEDEVEEEYSERQTQLRELMAEPQKPRDGRTLTFALVAIALLITIGTNFAEDKRQRALQLLFIAPFTVLEDDGDKIRYLPSEGLTNITGGEVWRLVTPVFLHFNAFHLLFDVLVLIELGGAFESRRGAWRLLLFFLAVAVVSNVGQFYLGGISWSGGALALRPSPLFGGLSGVDYGLFGYVWMKTRYEPELGFRMTPNLVVIMLGWYLLCFTGALGPVGNAAHAVGLVAGIVVGVAPKVWRAWFRRA